MKKFQVLFLMLILGFNAVLAQVEKSNGLDMLNPKAEKLLNDFVKALSIGDSDESAKTCIPLVHKSLLNQSGDDLTADLRRFSFKKAHENVKFYQSPVKITRIRKQTTTAIGFGDTAQKGTVYDYFIAKRSGVPGMPAPVQVFFPIDGSAPKICYMGSL